MDSAEDLRDRTKSFAIRVVRLVKHLPRDVIAYTIGNQVIRSATSIGANYRAACRARSRAEFIAKLHIVQEEADETQYWLEVLHGADAISEETYNALLTEAKELTAIFTASERTARTKKSIV